MESIPVTVTRGHIGVTFKYATKTLKPPVKQIHIEGEVIIPFFSAYRIDLW